VTIIGRRLHHTLAFHTVVHDPPFVQSVIALKIATRMLCLTLIACIAIAEAVTLPVTLIPSCLWSRLTAPVAARTSWHLTVTLTGRHRLSSVWGWLSVPASATAWARAWLALAKKAYRKGMRNLTLRCHGTTRTCGAAVLRKATVWRWLSTVCAWSSGRSLR